MGDMETNGAAGFVVSRSATLGSRRSKKRSRKRTLRKLWGGLLALGALWASSARSEASVAVLLEMPYGQLGTFNPTGHAALYFDHICAASPLELRPCAPGELGVVISRYDGIGDVDWVAVPLIPYLYGVEKAEDIPTRIDKLSALRIRDLYRREHLESVAPDTPGGGMPQGNWYELAGSAFDRTIYGFQVNTSAEQDAALMAYFNDRPNVTRYEGAFRNCADFTRVVLNHVYPHAIRRNYIADFGLSTPKSVARGLVHYARKHPEAQLQMFRVPQVEGSIPRSFSIQGVTGSLLTRYGVPMAVLAPHVTAVVLVAYIGKGRFAVPKNAPLLDVAGMEASARALQTEQVLTATATPEAPEVTAPVATETSVQVTAPAHEDRIVPAGAGFVPVSFGESRDCGNCESVPFLP